MTLHISSKVYYLLPESLFLLRAAPRAVYWWQWRVAGVWILMINYLSSSYHCASCRYMATQPGCHGRAKCCHTTLCTWISAGSNHERPMTHILNEKTFSDMYL